MNLNVFAKPRVEKILSQSLGVPVSIASMEVVLQEKRVSASDIRVSNPKGYSKPHAVTIDKVDIVLHSVGENQVNFDTIGVKGTKVYVEVKESGTNLSTLQKGIPKADPDSLGSQIKVSIKEFQMTQPTLYPAVTLISSQDLEPVKIRTVNVVDVGTPEKPISSSDVVKRISTHILRAAQSSAMKAGFYKGLSVDVLKDMGLNQVEALKGQIENEVKKLGDGLKKIFQ